MKKAFTLLELVFVIVVIGILSAAIIPRVGSDKLQEAAIQVVSHIRYTQHLAMMDDKFNIDDTKWYKKRWQIIFGESAYTDDQVAYTIFSDSASASSATNPNLSEMAIDPLNTSKYLSGGYSGSLYTSDSKANEKMNLGMSYDIDSVDFGGGCGSSTVRITFDHLGRPIKDALTTYTQSYKSNKLLETTCTITLNSSGGSIVIGVEPETGYTHIL